MKAVTREQRHKLMIVGACAALLVAVAALLCVILFLNKDPDEEKTPSQPVSSEASQQTSSSVQQESGENREEESTPQVSGQPEDTTEQTASQTPVDEAEDPQNFANGNMSEGSGANVDVSEMITEGVKETKEITFGIDVSKYQGTIDWEQVAAAGTDFVMVRVGYRTLVSGEIVADTNARYNMQQAQKYGIKVGAYFFSTAITEEEAVQEANWVADYISQYPITYPVAYNCEGFHDEENRQYGLTKTERTEIALAFLQTIGSRGYTPMFYASRNELQGDAQWETSRIDPLYKIWVAQYPAEPYPQTESSSYTGIHAMWQYTTNGIVPGISGSVDVNIAYFGYDGTEDAKNEEKPEDAQVDIEALMTFTEVNETVTAKIETNLRSHPSQGDESKVLYTLKNGEVATRIGVSDSGWSKLKFNGSVYYAVSSFLTTDLSYDPNEESQTEAEEDTQIKTKFTEVNEQVTAKEVVNLRNLPSTTHADSVVVTQLRNGEIAKRIGISDNGWSKLEYNGSVYYAVSSYLTTDIDGEDEEEDSQEITTQFTEVNEQVTAKEVVNLRTMPSTTNENSVVVAQLNNGEIITRTGINTDVGWSRVVYNGQVLYCVSSYLEPASTEAE